MQLELVDQRGRTDPLPVVLDALQGLVAELGRPDWWLNLVLVDDPQMTDLNQRWYGGQGPTDVLSFSYLETSGAGPAVLAAGEQGAACDLWLAPGEAPASFIAGEVIVAPGFVARRCASQGWSLLDEWPLLLVHGALHVLGWTHDTEQTRQAMQTEEATLLAAADLVHPLLPGPEGQS
jgi:probable rRNA maturation factor